MLQGIIKKITNKVGFLRNNRSVLNDLLVYKGNKRTVAYYIERLSYVGGTETRLVRIFEGMISSGYRVVVITTDRTINRYIIRNCIVYFVDNCSPSIVNDIINILISENAIVLEINHTPKFVKDCKSVSTLRSFLKLGYICIM